ncbi:PhaM family polyhydroxyalkanoate granule multifunctional regulatory protein [Hydromonas duriensis]|uniref:Uncharacterized protein n=1 Tax=Hydromonas duriensis TaxID=1527608 RepID=A0A4R6YBI4_9BURK|nr:PhaM family polyhydroxyalkanoate granule multifunctional regulatory protein [Hydromonas duriensis]TDR33037.1 hypothetical protein DFR44_10187 [Hydromonas duriensis]
MFSKIPAFFSMPNNNTTGDNAPSFSGMPLVNPLLNDAQTNIESLDERIQQLESVAQWLNMNLQMVNGTVQQLQVQKQTLQALAQWQALSKDALGELAKINPFAAAQIQETPIKAESNTQPNTTTRTRKPSKTNKSSRTSHATDESATQQTSAQTESAPPVETPAAFEQIAHTWWNGLQSQFAQLAQPMMQAVKSANDNANEPAPTAAKTAGKTTAVPKKSARPKVIKSK